MISWVLSLLLISCATLANAKTTQAAIHRAPIIIHGHEVRMATRYPLANYRLFRTGRQGEAIPVRFQIDEINQLGDYVLDQGSDITKHTGNGIFDLQDELVFMGDDVGPARKPTKWDVTEPPLLYEIRFTYSGGKSPSGIEEGAVYLGVYFGNAPVIPEGNYVVFDPARGEVRSTRYRYQFDERNYLVVNRVDMVRQRDLVDNDKQPAQGVEHRNDADDVATRQEVEHIPLLASSTFYLNANLKYFVTLVANHRSIDSKLEAYKVGPVRTIVRVSFFYSILSLRFELGMFTEVSFFSNSVVLPAIMHNPIDGPRSLNRGSGFYYGFALNDNPADLSIDTNMVTYRPASRLDFFRREQDVPRESWLSITSYDRMLYMVINPSDAMLESKNVPMLYLENVSSADMADRSNERAQELGNAPVNVGVYFDLTRFERGEHRMSFQLFFENYFNRNQLEGFRTLNRWNLSISRS